MSTESVQVAVRVRPFNKREEDRNATCIVRMFGPKTVLINPDTQEEKDFAFVRTHEAPPPPPRRRRCAHAPLALASRH